MEKYIFERDRKKISDTYVGIFMPPILLSYLYWQKKSILNVTSSLEKENVCSQLWLIIIAYNYVINIGIDRKFNGYAL